MFQGMRRGTRLWFNPFLSPRGADGSGSDDGDDEEDETHSAINLAAKATAILERNANNAQAAVAGLLREQYDGRVKRKELKRELADARAKIPAEGSMVLTKEQAAAWAAYIALGKPEDLKNQIESGAKNEKELGERREEDGIREAAKLAGFNFEVLRDQLRQRNLSVEVGEVSVEVDGKPQIRKVPQVKAKGDDKAKAEALAEYANREMKLYLPALTAGVEGGSQGDHQQETGAPWIEQTSTERGRAPANDVAAQHVQGKYAAPSKLREKGA